MKARGRNTIGIMLFAGLMIGIGGFVYCQSVAINKARSIGCVNHMRAIGNGALVWANVHAELMPTNFFCMSNELFTPKVLHCPADKTDSRVSEWAEFIEAKSSYVMESPGVKSGGTNAVFIRCRIHGHLGFPDGSVSDASRKKIFRKI